MKKQAKKSSSSKVIGSQFNQAKMGVVFALVFGLVGGYLLAISYAAKPGSGPSGSCYATPNPVAVNSDYTITGAGLGAGTIANLLVSDDHGTTAWNLQADANGIITNVGHAYWTGTSNVKFQVKNHNKWTVIASCSFTVQ